MNCIYAININGFDRYFNGALSSVSKNSQEDVLRFRREKDRHRKLMSLLLLRYMTDQHLGISDYSVVTNEFGKPSIKEHPQFQFNISHSGDWVVTVVSDSPIGIDIEVINETKDFMEIAKRFYSEREYKRLEQTKEALRIDMFFDIWTKKESLIKAVGKGLSIPLGSFTVPVGREGLVLYSNQNWNIKAPEFRDEKYKLAVCTSVGINSFVMNYLELNEVVFA